ncbi:HAD-IIA family hydrolase [soil metagenome]
MSATAAAPGPVLCDLDGVVWLSGVPLPGAPEAIAALRAAGRRVLFVTNNSWATVVQQEATLAEAGIPASGEVVTSAAAAVTLVQPGERVLVCGGPGVVEALEQRGATPVGRDHAEGVDVVVVGFHRDFDYDEMAVAAGAVRAGARLVATNSDATYPTPDGPSPGGGAILAGIAVAAGVDPVVAGKPHEPMVAAVAAAIGRDPGPMPDVIMVGDRVETDGFFAATLGAAFALVRTGVTPLGAALPPGITPAYDTADLASLVELLGR